MDKTVNEYEHNLFLINQELNRLETFFRSEFSKKAGSEVTKIINRSQHPTAHLCIKGEQGTEYARFSKHVRFEQTDYDEFNKEPVYEHHVYFYLTENRYRILSSVSYLFVSWDVQEDLTNGATIVLQLDSEKIVKYLDEFTKGGNGRLVEKGLPVINGVVGIPITALARMGVIVEQFTINWDTYCYKNQSGEERHLLPRSIPRAWGNYYLALTPPKRKILVVCKETKSYQQYESLKEAALDLMISNPNPDSVAGKKRIATAIACLSNCCQGHSNRVHGKDGLWYAVLDYDQAKEMEAAGTLKDEINRRFARKPRAKSRSKDGIVQTISA